MTKTFAAEWIFPISDPPMHRSTITIDGDRIAAVEPEGQRIADVDLGPVAILPGLVNAHVHLDLTGLRGQARPRPDFTGWLSDVIQHRRSRTDEEIERDVRSGLRESIARGVTLLCDVAGRGLSWPVLEAAPIRSVVCYELLGLTQARAESAMTEFRDWFGARPSSGWCRPGVSPHAPYSVRRSLFEHAAMEKQVTVATHVAETRAELELLKHHRGPYRRLLEELGVWDKAGLVESVDEVVRMHENHPSVLYVHGNYLPTGLPIRNGTVVYCPRTHAAFGHDRHPVRDLLDAGVRVAVGTDSLASNPDLDVLAEARFLRRRRPDLRGEELLKMITVWGAEALDWDEEVGTLEPGKSADYVVLPLAETDADDPCDLVLRTSSRPSRVTCRGRVVHHAGRP